MKKHARPTAIVWVALHMVIGLLGFIFIKVPGLHSLIGESTATGIGASLIAAGATGVTLFLYIRTSDDFRSRVEMLLDSGLVRVFEARSTRIKPEYDDRLKNSREIDIIGFGLSQLREDYFRQFAEWSHTKKVRIVVLDPEYPTRSKSYSTQRDKEERNPSGKIKADITAFVDAVKEIPNLNKTNFRIRYMKALPSVNVFRIDGEVFWGPYLMGQQSRNTLTLIAKEGGYVYKQIVEHFERVWDDNELSVDAL